MSKLLHILQHSLGVDQYGRGNQYRSHFVTGEGSVDYPTCNKAVAAGLMTVCRNYEPYDGMDVFYVTDAGRAYVTEHSPLPPKLTAAQRRYRDWLAADCDMAFGEWLKRKSKEKLA